MPSSFDELLKQIDWPGIAGLFLSGFASLAQVEFTFYNPAFWFCILLVFLLLSRTWTAKRAFSFTALAAVVLLTMTETESRLAAAFASPGETVETGIVRLVTLIVIAFLFLSYAFLK